MTVAIDWVVQVICDGSSRDKETGRWTQHHPPVPVEAFCVTRSVPDGVGLDQAAAILADRETRHQVDAASGVPGQDLLLTGDRRLTGDTSTVELLVAEREGSLRHSYTLTCSECSLGPVVVRHETIDPWIRNAAERRVSSLNLAHMQRILTR